MSENQLKLTDRVREIRLQTFGANGVATVSQALGIPDRTWENFENGVMIPASVILHFLVLTGAEPQWLLTGEGACYRDRPANTNQLASQ